MSMFPSLSLDDMTTMVTMHDTATMLRTTLTTDLIKSFLMTDKTVANVVKKIPFQSFKFILYVVFFNFFYKVPKVMRLLLLEASLSTISDDEVRHSPGDSR